MKKIYYLFLLFSLGTLSQIPSGYYDSASGLNGYTLKTQLKKIIDNNNDGIASEKLHIDKGYGRGTSTTNNGLWSAYGTTDRDLGIGYENDNTIVDIYSENPSGSDPYNFNFNTTSGNNKGQCGTYSVESDCYNREHLIPQSYFDNIATAFMKSDVQHVYPTDGKVNGIRNNYPFGVVSSATYTSLNGSKLGSATNSGYAAGYIGTVFEPINEFKGDIARVFFYFATRYEDSMDDFYNSVVEISSPPQSSDVPCKAMFNGSIDKVFSPTFLNILLTWHEQDPVSQKEIVRNNASYNHQNNRNPFIDHPEYVTAIWGPSLSIDSFALSNQITISPNPSNGIFKIHLDETLETINLEIYSTLGQKVLEKNSITTQEIEINDLSQGVYLAKFSKDNQVVVKKIVIN